MTHDTFYFFVFFCIALYTDLKMGANLSSVEYPGTHDPSFYDDIKTPYPAKDALSFVDALDQATVRIKIVPDNLYLKSDNGYFMGTSDVSAAGSFLVNVYNSSEIGFTYVPTGKTVYIHTQDDESLTQGIYDGQEVEKRFFISSGVNASPRINLFTTGWPTASGPKSVPVYLTPTGTGRSFGLTSSFRGWNIPETARKQVIFEIIRPYSALTEAYGSFNTDPKQSAVACCGVGLLSPKTVDGAAKIRACYGNGLGMPGACAALSAASAPPNSNPNDNPTINNANPNIDAPTPPPVKPPAYPITDTTPVVIPAPTTPTWVYVIILLVILAVLVTIILARKSKNNESTSTAAPGSPAPSLPASANA